MDNEEKKVEEIPSTEGDTTETGQMETKVEDPTPEEPKEDVVLVKTADLQAMMKRLDDLEGTVSAGKLEETRAKTRPKTLPQAYLKVYGGNIVTGWKSETAELLFHPTNSNMPVGEVLKTRLFYIDGTDSGIVDQISFTRTEDKVVVSISEDLGPNFPNVKIIFDELITTNASLLDNFKLPHDLEPFEVRKDFLNP